MKYLILIIIYLKLIININYCNCNEIINIIVENPQILISEKILNTILINNNKIKMKKVPDINTSIKIAFHDEKVTKGPTRDEKIQLYMEYNIKINIHYELKKILHYIILNENEDNMILFLYYEYIKIINNIIFNTIEINEDITTINKIIFMMNKYIKSYYNKIKFNKIKLFKNNKLIMNIKKNINNKINSLKQIRKKKQYLDIVYKYYYLYKNNVYKIYNKEYKDVIYNKKQYYKYVYNNNIEINKIKILLIIRLKEEELDKFEEIKNINKIFNSINLYIESIHINYDDMIRKTRTEINGNIYGIKFHIHNLLQKINLYNQQMKNNQCNQYNIKEIIDNIKTKISIIWNNYINEHKEYINIMINENIEYKNYINKKIKMWKNIELNNYNNKEYYNNIKIQRIVKKCNYIISCYKIMYISNSFINVKITSV